MTEGCILIAFFCLCIPAIVLMIFLAIFADQAGRESMANKIYMDEKEKRNGNKKGHPG